MKRKPEGEGGTCRGSMARCEECRKCKECKEYKEYKEYKECMIYWSFRQYEISVTVSLRNPGINNGTMPKAVEEF